MSSVFDDNWNWDFTFSEYIKVNSALATGLRQHGGFNRQGKTSGELEYELFLSNVSQLFITTPPPPHVSFNSEWLTKLDDEVVDKSEIN